MKTAEIIEGLKSLAHTYPDYMPFLDSTVRKLVTMRQGIADLKAQLAACEARPPVEVPPDKVYGLQVSPIDNGPGNVVLVFGATGEPWVYAWATTDPEVWRGPCAHVMGPTVNQIVVPYPDAPLPCKVYFRVAARNKRGQFGPFSDTLETFRVT